MADYAGLLRIDVDIHCPRCGRLKITTLKRFINAINDGSPLICGDCDSKFTVKLELLDPPARTPDTAETGIPAATNNPTMMECGNCGVPRFVHDGALEKCPNCGDDEFDLSLMGDAP